MMKTTDLKVGDAVSYKDDRKKTCAGRVVKIDHDGNRVTIHCRGASRVTISPDRILGVHLLPGA